MKTTKEYISLISSKTEELKRDFGIRSLRIFGSVSRNEQHEGSDVIRLHKHINPYLLDEIEKEGIYVIK